MLKSLKELLAPVYCLACNSPDAPWCLTCTSSWRSVDLQSMLGVPSIAAAHRAPELMQAISVWKDQGVRANSSAFAQLLFETLQKQPWWEESFSVVAIPDKRASLRRRGYSPLEDLLGEFRRLARQPKTPKPVISWSKEVSDQRGLSTTQRFENVSDAFRANVSNAYPLILIDDVVTSGATMRAAICALRTAGFTEVYAATLISSRSSQSQD